MPYDLIDHTGDVGIVVRAPTLEGVFAEAARAMFEILVEVPAPRAAETTQFPVRGEAPAEELRDLLSELLYRFSADHRVGVTFAAGNGTVTLGWEPYDPSRHALRTELKAVTYHRLGVAQGMDGWKAQVIFDV